MDLIGASLREAWSLIAGGDAELLAISGLTLAVAASSTAVALLIGIPAGMGLALARVPGRRPVLALANAGMGMPPVVAGLLVAIVLWRSGPLGELRLIYTPAAMVIAQAVIATPIVVAITAAAVMSLPPVLHLQIRAMGAGRAQYLWLVGREARLPLLAATMAGFGSVVSEVGASMMVGGNIAGETRVLTTATVLEVSRGNFGRALALGMILLALVLAVSVVLTVLQQRARRT